MITKTKVEETLKQLPDQFSVDELFDRLIFVQKVEDGLEDSRKGRTVSIEEAKKQMDKWLS